MKWRSVSGSTYPASVDSFWKDQENAMHGGTEPYEWYDAWILASLIFASSEESPVPLWRLIATADALNKAIVTRGELELALGRLSRGGHVRILKEGFEVSAEARTFTGPGGAIEAVANAIGAARWSAGTEIPQCEAEELVPASEYLEAEATYREEFTRMLKGTGRLAGPPGDGARSR